MLELVYTPLALQLAPPTRLRFVGGRYHCSMGTYREHLLLENRRED